MRIVACYSIFDEAPSIIRSLESVKWVDSIVVLDGAFSTYPHNLESGISDDGTVPLVWRWLDEWPGESFLILPRTPWPNQRFKRSFYFKFGVPGDWFLVIDGDEEVSHGGGDDCRNFLRNLHPSVDAVLVKEVVQIDYQSPWRNVTRWPGLAPRIIRFKPKLEYAGSYRRIEQVENVAEYPDFTMNHWRDEITRPEERNLVKAEHQTVEAFAAAVTVTIEDGRVCGPIARLIHWRPGLTYNPHIGRIESGEIEITHSGNEYPLSPLIIRQLDRKIERPDNPG